MKGEAKAWVLEAPRRFAERRYPIPDPDAGTVLIAMELCGICGTDLHYVDAELPADRYPMLLGHENVGHLAALGPGVTMDALGRPVREGDRVVPAGGAPAGMPCGRCYFCAVVKTPVKCIGGVMVPNADTPPHLFGGYSEYLYLRVPYAPFFATDLPRECAVLLEPLSIAVHAADRAGVRLGDTVVIQGSGAMGLLQTFCAKLTGAVTVIVVGGPSKRLALARELGADLTIDVMEIPDPTTRVERVRVETTRRLGADIVFECAGVTPAIGEGLAMVRDSGTFVEVGHFVDDGRRASVNPAGELVRRNLRVEAPFASTVEHYARALRLLEKHASSLRGVVSHRLPLERVPEAIDALRGAYRLDDREVIKITVGPQAGSPSR